MRQQANIEGAAGAAFAGRYPARVPLAQAAVAQAAAALLVLVVAVLVPEAAQNGDAMTWALLQGIVAASLARVLGMDIWWLPIQALFAPGLVWTLGYGLPPAYALAAFFALASVFWGVSHTRVPFFLTSRAAARALAKLVPRDEGFAFIDLGCGIGGVLASLARARPRGRYHGIEAAPLPFLLSWLRSALGPHACRIRWGDLGGVDLGRYDVVYAYLSPAAMGHLWRKARREMRHGSLLISNSFEIPGVAPTASVAIGAPGEGKLLLWRM